VTTLERHVVRLRSRVEERAWSMLIAAASPESRSKLEALLLIQDGGHQSLLDRLRRGPYRRSAPELVRALLCQIPSAIIHCRTVSLLTWI